MRLIHLALSGLCTASTALASSIGPQVPLKLHEDLPSAAAYTLDSRAALLSLHKHLVEIESITQNEAPAASYLKKYLQSLDLTVESQPIPGSSNRTNLYAYIGSTRKTATLVSSHIDTVPPFWKYEVRQGKTPSEDEIWGRGTVDDKGSVASQIAAFVQLMNTDEISEGDVGLLFVVGEETDGVGMRTANDLGIAWKAAIFGEPTELKLASGHKGTMTITIAAHGKAGHSGYPSLGRSANLMLIEALYALEQTKLPSSEKYGNTTVNIGTISGGVAPNVIAERASAKIAIRLAAGKPEDHQKIIEKQIGKLGYGDDLQIEFSPGYGPVPIDDDIDSFEKIVVNYGTDIPNLKGDHKRYLYGPGDILVAHSDHEHLKVSDLETAVEGYKTLIKATLKA